MINLNELKAVLTSANFDSLSLWSFLTEPHFPGSCRNRIGRQGTKLAKPEAEWVDLIAEKARAGDLNEKRQQRETDQKKPKKFSCKRRWRFYRISVCTGPYPFGRCACVEVTFSSINRFSLASAFDQNDKREMPIKLCAENGRKNQRKSFANSAWAHFANDRWCVWRSTSWADTLQAYISCAEGLMSIT